MDENKYEDAKKGVSNKERFCVTISKDTVARFKQFVESQGYDPSKLTERILNEFLTRMTGE